jgi:hypothetical protein
MHELTTQRLRYGSKHLLRCPNYALPQSVEYWRNHLRAPFHFFEVHLVARVVLHVPEVNHRLYRLLAVPARVLYRLPVAAAAIHSELQCVDVVKQTKVTMSVY